MVTQMENPKKNSKKNQHQEPKSPIHGEEIKSPNDVPSTNKGKKRSKTKGPKPRSIPLNAETKYLWTDLEKKFSDLFDEEHMANVKDGRDIVAGVQDLLAQSVNRLKKAQNEAQFGLGPEELRQLL